MRGQACEVMSERRDNSEKNTETRATRWFTRRPTGSTTARACTKANYDNSGEASSKPDKKTRKNNCEKEDCCVSEAHHPQHRADHSFRTLLASGRNGVDTRPSSSSMRRSTPFSYAKLTLRVLPACASSDLSTRSLGVPRHTRRKTRKFERVLL
jgi:hypothetical protein